MASQPLFSDNINGLDIIEPNLDPTIKVKIAMREAIKTSGLSREQVADEMTRLARINGIHAKISLPLLDKWVAQQTAHIIPWKLLPIFCRVTQTILPLQALVSPLGAKIVVGKDKVLLEWAKVEVQRREVSKKARQLWGQI